MSSISLISSRCFKPTSIVKLRKVSGAAIVFHDDNGTAWLSTVVVVGRVS